MPSTPQGSRACFVAHSDDHGLRIPDRVPAGPSVCDILVESEGRDDLEGTL